ncbi:GGDEF domain-containing protein [Pseudoalteromonas sp. P94(2023)]|uniref:diguanylate cyclase n=2 Tax=Pseudoalteromonas obscura TaxID=3048491 RepID=A0ABT7EJ92_9GAMM|nr:GGDEF domain-containing protein [Pseudoalteromonas sp. P94(2023)]
MGQHTQSTPLLDNLQLLLKELREPAAVFDNRGQKIFANRVWQFTKQTSQNAVQTLVSERNRQSHECQIEGGNVSIAQVSNYQVVIFFQEQSYYDLKDKILKSILGCVDCEESIFTSITRVLGELLGWRWVAVNKFKPDCTVEVLAHWDTNQLVDNFTYSLAGVPCESVEQTQKFTRFENLTELFPNDTHIQEIGAQVYAGYVYKDSRGCVVGHIFLMHDNSFVNWSLAEDVLHMASVIIGKAISLQQKEQEVQKHKHLAERDNLTGVFNQLAFDRDIAAAFKAQTTDSKNQFVIAVIDLDGMKQINDQLGHQQGDKLLQTFAQELSAACRDSDRAYRIGGDEFVVIYYLANLDLAKVLKERLNQAIANVVARGFEQVGASIGFAASSEGDKTAKGIFALADERMYQDKRLNKQNMRK